MGHVWLPAAQVGPVDSALPAFGCGRARAVGKTWGQTPIPPHWEWGSAKRRSYPTCTYYASMRSRANRLPAARAGLAGFAFLSFGYEKRRVWDWQALRSYHSSATLRKSMHPTCTFCASMCSLTNRLPAARAELAGSAFLSFGCEKRRVQNWQAPHSPHSGIKKLRKSGAFLSSGALLICECDKGIHPSLFRRTCLLLRRKTG